MPRTGCQARVVDARHQGVALKKARQHQRVGRGTLHAQGHGLDATKQQPAVPRTQRRALGVLHKVQALGKVVAFDSEHACRDVTVAANKLGGGGHANVGAKRQR